MQWLPFLWLAALTSGPLCHADRIITDTERKPETEQHESTTSNANPTEKLESPKPKQHLFETVDEMLNGSDVAIIDNVKTASSEGTSLAEMLADVRSCAGRSVWVRTDTPMLGKGAYAEIFEVGFLDIQNSQLQNPPYHLHIVHPHFALKVASNEKDGKPLTPEEYEDAKKDVDAEANILATIHGNYRAAGNSDLCPNVVPLISNRPCFFDENINKVRMLEGAYVTKKMGGDLFGWKKANAVTCSDRSHILNNQLLTGLNCLHNYGQIVHDDLKHDNVLYDKLSGGCPENLFIADFGLSEPLGKVTDAFNAKDIRRSVHLVTDIFETGASNLDIQRNIQSTRVAEVVLGTDETTRFYASTAEKALIPVGPYESKEQLQNEFTEVIDNVKHIMMATEYLVDKRIDYCSLIHMLWTTFGWGVKIPSFDRHNLKCGKMGRYKGIVRVQSYTGDMR